MRRRDKKQLLDLIKTMEMANQILPSMLKQDRYQEMTAILADEQEAALSIGSRVELLEGEGTEAVKLLEDYCELLWDITQAERLEQKIDGVKKLSLLLVKEKEALDRFPVKLNVVFLPYKASMWDCMETVWQAAERDPECNAYVIPIPYFDLKPDGSFGEIHYEADLIPDYVPTVSWKDYNIQKEHPDIIYIHNPYDNYNRVTSIHPDFYCSVIKNYTDMLVYIPYFLTNGRMPDSHQFLPSYLEVDRIILQGETMVNDISLDVPREKLLPLGSPKAERVAWLEAHKNQIDFPKEWYQKAAGKKVMLYNVSISGLLKYRDKILDKMEEVFQVVSQDERVILLWRPHPLLEATLNSMCRDLKERYQKLMRWFKKKNIGILDNTADPDMAVAFADAYIGEMSSSMVDLFRVVDKPRLFLTEKKYYQPTLDELLSERSCDVCIVDNEMWFVTTELQLLCKCELGSGQISVMAEIPEVPHSYLLRYIGIVNYDNKIILVPRRGDAICIYNRDTNSFIKYYFNQEYVTDCFGGIVLHDHYLFLTPLDYPAVVRFDILAGKFEYFIECISDMMRNIKKLKSRSAFTWTVGTYGDEFFLASSWSNQVLCFNMETLQYNIHEVGLSENMWRGIVSDQENSWLIVYDSPKIVKWNRKTGETKEYNSFPDGFTAGNLSYKNILNFKDDIYVLAFEANHSCKLNKQTEIITYVDFGLNYEEASSLSPYYELEGKGYDFGKKKSESEIVAFSLYDDSFVFIDVNSNLSTRIPLRVKERLFWNMRKKYESRKEMVESQEYTMSEFINCVTGDLFDKNVRYCGWQLTEKEICPVGENVHKRIKEELEKRIFM